MSVHTAQTNASESRLHYDTSHAFYQLWPDAERVFSCAYFTHPDESLDQAQHNQLHYLCRKLRLQPGEHLLDMECGTGALLCWAARHYGVYGHGIALSEEHYHAAQKKIHGQGLEQYVRIALQAYRGQAHQDREGSMQEGEARYNKIVSISMIDRMFDPLPPPPSAEDFRTIQRLLKPGGLFLHQSMTREEKAWNSTASSVLTDKDIFPNGLPDTVGNLQKNMELHGFEIHDVENLRMHAALTLRHWINRLENQREAALTYLGEERYNAWHSCMTSQLFHFEMGGIGLYQILLSRKTHGFSPLPLTRNDLYKSDQNDGKTEKQHPESIDTLPGPALALKNL